MSTAIRRCFRIADRRTRSRSEAVWKRVERRLLDLVEPGADGAVDGVAELLVSVGQGLRELGGNVNVEVDGRAAPSGPRPTLDDGT